MKIQTTARHLPMALLCVLTALPAMADTRFQARQMVRNDVPAGKGQCDIRLQVDGEVEVSVRGDMVFIRTISGRDARDDGSECNAPLPPRDPAGFGFEIKDSRGDIRLVAEPSRRSDYAAIVRIRDSKGGEGRYHFRLSWALGGGDRMDDRRGPDRMDDRRGPDRMDDRRGGFGGWNRTVDFSGRGEGRYSRDGSGFRRIFGTVVRIDRDGNVSVEFNTEGWGRVAFSGRIIRMTGDDRIFADMLAGDGSRMRGEMSIAVSGNRVRDISMSGAAGRDRCEISWRDY